MLISGLAVLVLVGAGCQGQTRASALPSTIEGIPPYALGASREAILNVNPRLERGPGNADIVELTYQNLVGDRARRVSTDDYHGVLKGGAEGLTQDAVLSLQFLDGRLAAVIVFWLNAPHLTPPLPREVQISTADAQALYRRLVDKYGQPARDTLRATDGRAGYMVIRDTQKNALIMSGNNPGFGVILWYIWAPLVEAVGEPP